MSNKIPKKIWMLWLQGWDVAPEIVQECKKSWEVLNPEWEVLLLDEENLKKFVDASKLLANKDYSIQTKADLIRLRLLEKYGGLWVDATVYCTRPLDTWLVVATQQTGFFVFSNPGRDRLVSNWCIAATPNNYMVTSWLTRFEEFLQTGPIAPTLFRKIYNKLFHSTAKQLRLFPILQPLLYPIKRLFGLYPYLICHYIFSKEYKQNEKFRELWDQSYHLPAHGPHVLKKYGLSQIPTPFIEKIISQPIAPMYKLDWRIERKPGTVIDVLLSTQRTQTTKTIPKKIWMLWLQGWDVAPEIVQECKKSWEVLNPEWEVLLLDEENLGAYIDLNPYGTVSRIPRQAFSDIVRIELLAKYGGVWVDASVFCAQPLDEWVDEHASLGFFAFSKPQHDKLISSWFLAAQPNTDIATKLCTIVRTYWSRGPIASQRVLGLYFKICQGFILLRQAWLLKKTMFVTKRYFGLFPYYWFHYSFDQLCADDRLVHTTWHATPVIPADKPHQLFFHGLLEKPNEPVLQTITHTLSPVHKLSWRIDIGNVKYVDTTIMTLIRDTKNRYNY